MKSQFTELVRASELDELVVQRIFTIREPGAIPQYKKALAKYNRRRGKRPEQKIKVPDGFFGEKVITGFVAEIYDKQIPVERPKRPHPRAYARMSYDRSFGFTTHAQTLGLLANPRYNRDLRPERVDAYAREMQAGNWRDLLSDPITITDDGQVLNGQHRLAAATQTDWAKAGNDPLFLVIWNVDPAEAQYADGSNRTARDERMIAQRLLKAGDGDV